ncbi:MAG: hypothetical protein DRI90_17750 [Deltaproteobacteria bacterium]|nr:MAG: hypothetical protein DRI90_17750 [Deltaproteobacteria bacterium]
MAKECVGCGKKIGFFKKAFEGVYCSEECAEKSQQEMAAQQQQADALRDEAKQRSAAEAEQEQAEKKAAAKLEQQRNTCPKCGQAWQYTPASEAGGVQTGHCSACGLKAEFTAIEPCPNCRAEAFLITPDGPNRCPRCKHSA